MINSRTGEVFFLNGRCLRPDMLLPPQVLMESTPRAFENLLVVPLGLWHADHGAFVVEVVTDADVRLRAVLLCHWHGMYRIRAKGDPERAAFHARVVQHDLSGQNQFPWGAVYCRLDGGENRNWIVIQYADGPHVPELPPAVLGPMYAHATEDNAHEEARVRVE